MQDSNTPADPTTRQLLLRVQRLEANEMTRKHRLRTWWRAVGLTAGALIVALPGLATALGPVPNVFSDGDMLSAAEMNANFEHVVAAITALEEAEPSGPDQPCGMTAAVDGGLGGYDGGAVLCADTCGDPLAHICTSHELIRNASSGGSVAGEGWVATGVWSNWVSNGNVDDCVSFTSGSSGSIGVTWGANDIVSVRFCGGAGYPLHCCAPP